jgi:hypothetical protein
MIGPPARIFLGVAAAAAVIPPAGAIAAEPTPASVPAPNVKPGDAWVFERSLEHGTANFAIQRIDLRIERVGTDTMVVGIKPDGAPVDFEDHAVGADWSQRRLVDGNQTTTARPFSFPLVIGKTWASDYVDPNRHGLQTSAEHHATYKVAGWEDVTTPAGSFHAIRIESDDKVKAQFLGASSAIGGAVASTDGSTLIAQSQKTGPDVAYAEFFSTFYYAPDTKYWVKTVEGQFNSENVRTQRKSEVLVSFKPAP